MTLLLLFTGFYTYTSPIADVAMYQDEKRLEEDIILLMAGWMTTGYAAGMVQGE